IPAIREAGYEVGIVAEDAEMLPSYDYLLEDNSVIEIGRLRIHTIHNPGHTPGSMSFHVEGTPLLFTGDTLFPGGPGNTFNNANDFKTIITSIEDRMFSKFDAGTIVLPGHGDDTTIGAELPHLQDWVDRGW
ncbi:MAG: MBL fold metallo-hydrolase, partial [Actinobacteria bacterium]|nr:MBL fold metallo-hydrolase [Actinomycetota bacterium]